MAYSIRKAIGNDKAALTDLIALSARKLSTQDYTAAQIEGALRGTYGVDSQLIKDGTYFVAESDGEIVGCGGWSRRRTICGSDSYTERDDAELDPATDAAKIRAFFIHPEHARQGVGKMILERCEAEAIAHGFARLELMATLPGVPFYTALGYERGTPVTQKLDDGITIEFVPMYKGDQDAPAWQKGGGNMKHHTKA
jgi:GNAT superfamily N-acetyltransferase